MTKQDVFRAKNNPEDAFTLIRFEVDLLASLIKREAASDTDISSTLRKIRALTGEEP